MIFVMYNFKQNSNPRLIEICQVARAEEFKKDMEDFSLKSEKV